MPDRIDGLTSILFDNTAREDERHDAAMDIGKYNDDRALSALLQLASNPNEMILFWMPAENRLLKFLLKEILLRKK